MGKEPNPPGSTKSGTNGPRGSLKGGILSQQQQAVRSGDILIPSSSEATMPPNFAFAPQPPPSVAAARRAAAPKPEPEDVAVRVARLKRAWEAECAREGPKRSEQV